MSDNLKQTVLKITENKLTINSIELKQFYDDLIEQLEDISNEKNVAGDERHLLSIIKSIIEIDGLILTDELLSNHTLYALLRDQLRDIILRWNENNTLTVNESDYYRDAVILFEIMLEKNVSFFQKLILNEQFIQSIIACIDHISKNEQLLNDKTTMIIFNKLFLTLNYKHLCLSLSSTLDDSQFISLVNSTLNCICSPHYYKTFVNLNYQADQLQPDEYFLLIICPSCLVNYEGKHQDEIYCRLIKQMLEKYKKILDHFIPFINNWKSAIIRSITESILTIILHATLGKSCSTDLCQDLSLINYLTSIIRVPSLIEKVKSSTYNYEIQLIDIVTGILCNLSYHPNTLLVMKNNEIILSTFMNLRNVVYHRIQIGSYLILAGILTDQKIQELNNAAEITSILLNYLKLAMESPSQSYNYILVEELLYALRGK
ncbi:unnamed protein product [Didymodactylos carnosus]|uniref:Uncharacterized protein n=1 Tax=Didymodactylos carnosus TaxID=1234261 RepID=A0A814HHI8_9BILA|nr:unnamed protein product [Didymodactylos carnosus]CAF3782265.1 unnamed protein product [Didymodactylos carnosus]